MSSGIFGEMDPTLNSRGGSHASTTHGWGINRPGKIAEWSDREVNLGTVAAQFLYGQVNVLVLS
jgi:hypothetical protein